MQYQLTRNHWESHFFGREIATLTFGSASVPFKSTWHLIQSRISTDNHEQLSFLQQQGFQLVETAVVFTLSLSSFEPHNTCDIVPAIHSDRAELAEQFSCTFLESRFRPPYFSLEESQMLYQKWLDNAISGEFDHYCWLERDESSRQIKGVISLRLEQKYARIGLLAVAPHFRRQGVASRLIHRAAEEAKKQGADYLHIHTQLANSAAIALYQSLGAYLTESYYWLYK